MHALHIGHTYLGLNPPVPTPSLFNSSAANLNSTTPISVTVDVSNNNILFSDSFFHLFLLSLPGLAIPLAAYVLLRPAWLLLYTCPCIFNMFPIQMYWYIPAFFENKRSKVKRKRKMWKNKMNSEKWKAEERRKWEYTSIYHPPISYICTWFLCLLFRAWRSLVLWM